MASFFLVRPAQFYSVLQDASKMLCLCSINKFSCEIERCGRNLVSADEPGNGLQTALMVESDYFGYCSVVLDGLLNLEVQVGHRSDLWQVGDGYDLVKA